jgi:hypothetical protein
MYRVSRFPDVVTFGISFPLDQILEFLISSKVMITVDELHLIFFFSSDKVRWWSGEVWSM